MRIGIEIVISLATAVVVQLLLLIFLITLASEQEAQRRRLMDMVKGQQELIRDQDIHISALQKALLNQAPPTDVLVLPGIPPIEIWLN